MYFLLCARWHCNYPNGMNKVFCILCSTVRKKRKDQPQPSIQSHTSSPLTCHHLPVNIYLTRSTCQHLPDLIYQSTPTYQHLRVNIYLTTCQRLPYIYMSKSTCQHLPDLIYQSTPTYQHLPDIYVSTPSLHLHVKIYLTISTSQHIYLSTSTWYAYVNTCLTTPTCQSTNQHPPDNTYLSVYQSTPTWQHRQVNTYMTTCAHQYLSPKYDLRGWLGVKSSYPPNTHSHHIPVYVHTSFTVIYMSTPKSYL